MEIKNIKISDIEIIDNHRTNVDDTRIDELMVSMRQHGLQQSIGVAKGKKRKYQLVYGQRRLIAGKKLGWETMPAEVLGKVDIKRFHILSLTENMQREDPSFNEMGRTMEQLEELGLNIAEISARLGIKTKRVNSIMKTYKKLPPKHRKKVRYCGKGEGRKKGDIPPQVATKILAIQKSVGMPSKILDQLFEYAIKAEMSTEDLKNLGILLKTGISLEQAIEELHSVFVYNVNVVLDRLELTKRMEKDGLTSTQNYLKRIIYGKTGPLTKPKFIKV